MREIKFRGKSKYKDHLEEHKWVYGDLITSCSLNMQIQYKGWYRVVECDVIDDTVGQYTGLKDKRGKEIYEGDIVSTGCTKGVVFYDNSGAWFSVKLNGYCIELRFYVRLGIEVIGNIHDNTELIKQ